MTDADGHIGESYRYDAFGNVSIYDSSNNLIDESLISNRYLWQGREYDFDTGLYNFRARWYCAETGRWLSKDPIGISGGVNQYVFCANNPVNFVDPTGLCPPKKPLYEIWLDDNPPWLDRSPDTEFINNTNDIPEFTPLMPPLIDAWKDATGIQPVLPSYPPSDVPGIPDLFIKIGDLIQTIWNKIQD